MLVCSPEAGRGETKANRQMERQARTPALRRAARTPALRRAARTPALRRAARTPALRWGRGLARHEGARELRDGAGTRSGGTWLLLDYASFSTIGRLRQGLSTAEAGTVVAEIRSVLADEITVMAGMAVERTQVGKAVTITAAAEDREIVRTRRRVDRVYRGRDLVPTPVGLVYDPFKDIAGHVKRAVRAGAAWEGANARRIQRLLALILVGPVLGRAVGVFTAPRERAGVDGTAGCLLPLRLSGQALAGPGAILNGVVAAKRITQGRGRTCDSCSSRCVRASLAGAGGNKHRP